MRHLDLIARTAFVANLRARGRVFAALSEAIGALEASGEPLTLPQQLELVDRLEDAVTRGLTGEVFRAVAEERGWIDNNGHWLRVEDDP